MVVGFQQWEQWGHPSEAGDAGGGVGLWVKIMNFLWSMLILENLETSSGKQTFGCVSEELGGSAGLETPVQRVSARTWAPRNSPRGDVESQRGRGLAPELTG